MLFQLAYFIYMYVLNRLSALPKIIVTLIMINNNNNDLEVAHPQSGSSST